MSTVNTLDVGRVPLSKPVEFATALFKSKYIILPAPLLTWCIPQLLAPSKFLIRIHFGTAPKPCPTVAGDEALKLLASPYFTILNPAVVLAWTVEV